MFPEDENQPTDIIVDDNSTTLRATAELFEKSAADAADTERREILLEYANLYRQMAKLSELDDGDAEDK